MSNITYTYSVIRYVHDPAAGEMLNVGVVLYAPDVTFLDIRFETRYERLSDAFADFDGDHYRRTLRQFCTALTDLWNHLTGGLSALWDLPPDVGALGAQIWPDTEMSFRLGPVLAGLTTSPIEALESLFNRMVTSQHNQPREQKQTDEDVWGIYQRAIPREVRRVLSEKTFATEEFELKFDHAFRNERWHALQPISMDYARPEGLQRKATHWLGNTVALQDNRELGKLYLLLGPPQLEAHRIAYNRAKNLLHKMPVSHELIEEDAAEDFANFLVDYLREHGVLEVVSSE